MPKSTRKTASTSPIKQAFENKLAAGHKPFEQVVSEALEKGSSIRTFETGALRDSEAGKLDFEGFLSPQALEAFAQYMHFHRQMPDGTLRASDNWQKGIPPDVLMKSAWRHFFALWSLMRNVNYKGYDNKLADACGVLFNIQALIKHFMDLDPTLVKTMLETLEAERQIRAKVVAR